MVNFSSLKTKAEMTLAKLTEGKYYELGDLSSRLQEAAEIYPHDTVIKAVARVIEQLHKKGQSKLISQGDIEKVYNELIGLNVTGTKFREVLGDLLISEKPASAEPNLNYTRGMRDDPEAGVIEYDIDSNVKKGFDKLFNPIADKYDPKCADLAKEKVGLELRSLGFDNVKIRLAGGDSKFLIFATDFDTNRGSVRVFIPAEASGTQLPSVFIAGNRFDELTSNSVNEYLVNASYRNNRLPNVSDILNTLNALTAGAKVAVPDGDFSKLADSLPNSNGSEGLSGPGVFASLPDNNKNVRDVEIPLTPTPEPLKALASEIEENVIEASVGYPQAVVRMTKRMLVAELSSMGFKNSQVRVSHSTNDGFICDAVLNTTHGKVSIEVPIEIKENSPLLPSVFAKNDFVDNFDATSLHAFATKNENVEVFIEADNNLNGMNLLQLKDIITKSAMKGDFNTCDEAILVIGKKFDEDTHRNVVTDYYKMLINFENNKNIMRESYHNDDDQFIKTPNSIYPIHKKLGRPANELIKDEDGVYHLKSTYRSRQNQKAAGAFFSNAKALIGD
jgi:hypothetical protein